MLAEIVGMDGVIVVIIVVVVLFGGAAIPKAGAQSGFRQDGVRERAAGRKARRGHARRNVGGIGGRSPGARARGSMPAGEYTSQLTSMST